MPTFYKEWAVRGGLFIPTESSPISLPPQHPTLIKSGHGMLYKFVFGRLGLDRAVMDVVESNKKVQRFHAVYGAEPIDAPLRYADEHSEALKLVWLGFAKDKWPAMKSTWTLILKAFCS